MSDVPPIKQGQIWLAMSSFWSTGERLQFNRSFEKARRCRIEIKKSEFLEVRYAYEWHLRTEDNIYFHVLPKTILDNCLLFGQIYETVDFENKTKLNEIMKKGLYDLADNFPKAVFTDAVKARQ